MAEILLVEDDLDVAKLVTFHAQAEGLSIVHVTNAEEAEGLIANQDFSVIILDWRLPKMDGIELCRRIRAAGNPVSIIMLTGRTTEIDRILGLEIGADDYVTKPFSPRELLARVRAAIRRYSFSRATTQTVAASFAETVTYGPLSIDIARHQVKVADREVSLTAREFELLVFLACHPGRVFGRGQLLENVWEYDADGYEPVVTTYVNRLRAKIESDPSNPIFVKTVQGVGYKFCEASDFTG